LLVIDDVDLLLNNPMTEALPAMRAWCEKAGFAMIPTGPEEPLLWSGQVRPEVRRELDVALRLRRVDQFDPLCDRAGEADLRVVSHRRGPTADLQLGFEGHYRRFVTRR
jgi:hypothetical protein